MNARNLVAHTGPQRRLQAEFADGFPGILYETRPDETVLKAEKRHVIHNDDAAQLLCAVYLQEPWLAVKRNALFEAEDYPRIFNEGVHAEQIVLLDAIRQMIDRRKNRVPDRYRRSWKLTRLVLVYLVSQVMRADEEMLALLDAPKAALNDRAQLTEDMRLALTAAIATLRKRRDARERDQADDDYTVDFKNRDALRTLRDQARNEYLTMVEYERELAS